MARNDAIPNHTARDTGGMISARRTARIVPFLSMGSVLFLHRFFVPFSSMVYTSGRS